MSHSGQARQSGPGALLEKLTAALGAKWVTSDVAGMDGWLTDWRGRYTGRPLAMVSPANTMEVAAVVGLCADNGVPIVTQGGNSGMVGGATPDDSGTQLLLSTRRLTDLAIKPEAATATCGAGVILQNLHEAAAGHDLRFPLTLGGKGSATIGGLVSTNAGGTQVLRHGTMRRLTLGLEVVLPDRRVLAADQGLHKDNRGFDLKQLFIGSEGTLGIITQVQVRLVPAIAERVVVWAGVRSLADARNLLLLCQSTLNERLEGFEVLPQACLDNVLDFLPAARAPLPAQHPWHALLEFAGGERTADGLRAQVEQCLAQALAQGLCQDAVIAASDAQADALWLLRESIAPAEKARGPAVQHDIAVPPDAMPAVVEQLGREVVDRFPLHDVRAFGHLGDGNIHFHVVAPRDAPADWAKGLARDISAFVYDRITQFGGTISAEHGIGQDKLATLARTHDPVALDLMRAVKRALDPAGLLNPGKLVPLARDHSVS